MDKRIRANMERYFEDYEKGIETIQTISNHMLELGDLIHKMWREDLISTEVRCKCDMVMNDSLARVLKLMKIEKEGR